MRAWVLLRSNPYMATSDGDGRFEINNLPVGRHVFRIWHERAGYVPNLRLEPSATDATGRLTVIIRAGNNDLQDAALSPELFKSEE